LDQHLVNQVRLKEVNSLMPISRRGLVSIVYEGMCMIVDSSIVRLGMYLEKLVKVRGRGSADHQLISAVLKRRLRLTRQ
jgi:hypothetical protein